MPTLKVKTIYIDKLKALGCYDAWLSNLKDSKPSDFKLIHISNYNFFQSFISGSFLWVSTPEGREFWSDISNK